MDKTPENPVFEDGNKKLIYCTRNAKIVPGNTLLGTPRLDCVNVMVLLNENYVHDEWHGGGRTSKIDSVTFNERLGTVDVETRNSIYRVIDNSVDVGSMVIAQLESLYEATFMPGGGECMPSYTQLLALFESYEMYPYFKDDDRLVNMLKDVAEPDRTGYNDFLLRLMYRAPLRKFLTLFCVNGGETKCDLGYGRV